MAYTIYYNYFITKGIKYANKLYTKVIIIYKEIVTTTFILDVFVEGSNLNQGLNIQYKFY